MIRRLGLLLLLPLVWLPLFALALYAVPALPWWSWPVGLLFVVLWRRRRALGAVVGDVDEGGARYSPVKGGGGF